LADVYFTIAWVSKAHNIPWEWKVCRKRPGIEGAARHSWSHIFLTWLWGRKVWMQKKIEFARQKGIETTIIYVNLVMEYLKDSVNELDFVHGKGYKNCGKICGEGDPVL